MKAYLFSASEYFFADRWVGDGAYGLYVKWDGLSLRWTAQPEYFVSGMFLAAVGKALMPEHPSTWKAPTSERPSTIHPDGDHIYVLKWKDEARDDVDFARYRIYRGRIDDRTRAQLIGEVRRITLFVDADASGGEYYWIEACFLDKPQRLVKRVHRPSRG